MVVIVGSNIYSETWNLLYSLISGNITEPAITSPARAGSRWVLGAFPDVEGKDFAGYPIVVVENAEKSTMKEGFSTSGINTNEISVSVYAYSKAPRELNILSEDISDAVLANRSVLATSGFTLTSLDNGIQGTDLIGNSRIHFREQIIRGMV